MTVVATAPASALAGLRGRFEHGASLARHTTWRCGGAAERLYFPADRDDLAALLRQLPAEEPLTVLGLGSNVLVRDGGIAGTVVILHACLAELAMRDGLVYAQAGVPSPKVARFAALQDLGEAEFLAGIPGTLGGALAMNAGCYGDEIWRHVSRVEVLTRSGRFELRHPTDYVIGYRSVRRVDPGADGSIFTAAWLSFPSGSAAIARERIKALLGRRVATQPLGLPNAGSVFRNPEGDHAARLIESCGLKGYTVGGASVSVQHANFIVNPGGVARAADIEAIIDHVRTVVRTRTGVDLQPEVRVLGKAGHAGREAH